MRCSKLSLLAFLLVFILTGCGSSGHIVRAKILDLFKTCPEHGITPESPSINQSKLDASFFNYLANNFSLVRHYKHTKVKFFAEHYTQQRYHLEEVLKRAKSYIYYVAKEVEKRQLPLELALLPIIESTYQPHATSSVGASGIWQLGRPTAVRYGVIEDEWFDGRKCIVASTGAALDYLSFLHKEFNKDWLLALAAYNAGEGRVKAAIRQNIKKGKSISFWKLPLPLQTKQFVPKILGMASIIFNHRLHNLVDYDIPNEPSLTAITLQEQISLPLAASIIDVPYKEIQKYNPGYKLKVSPPQRAHTILLPTHKSKNFRQKLVSAKKTPAKFFKKYKIKPGDSLIKIAKKFDTDVALIRQINNLKNNVIIAGKHIFVPSNNL